MLVKSCKKGSLEQYSTAQVKQSTEAAEVLKAAQSENDESLAQISISNMTDIHGALHQFLSTPSEIKVEITEIIQSDDPISNYPLLAPAIQEEIKDLLKRGIFKVILREEIPDGANVLTAVNLLEIKSKSD